MKYLYFLLSFLFLTNFSYGQKKDAYQLYNAKAKKVSFKKAFKKMQKSDIILFGEFHNNPIAHWLQYEVTKELNEAGIPLVIGAEMFERDNQESLQQFMNGEITDEEFREKVRLWSNYTTDYEPLLLYAKSQNIPYVATNIPRRYASKVFKEGGFEALEKLTDEEKLWIAPLPVPFDIELPTYKNMLQMMGGEHANPDIVKAQAIKDATMAHFILKHLKESGIFLHLNGSYHSNFYEGIYWYLETYGNTHSIFTIATVEQEDISSLEDEYKGIADLIICIPATMTKTY